MGWRRAEVEYQQRRQQAFERDVQRAMMILMGKGDVIVYAPSEEYASRVKNEALRRMRTYYDGVVKEMEGTDEPA